VRQGIGFAARVSGAFTLVETMVVVVLVMVLGALLFAGFRATIGQARSSVDASNLRQIGQAAEMYAAGHDGERTLSAGPLVVARLVSPEIVVSPLDVTEEGIANRFLEKMLDEIKKEVTLPCRTSYVGMREGGKRLHVDWMRQEFEEMARTRRDFGWLVNVARFSLGSSGEDHVMDGSGPYQRLLLDGSLRAKRRNPEDPKVFDDLFGDPPK
jgi:type II secretory pathway pseudopilin PulG